MCRALQSAHPPLRYFHAYLSETKKKEIAITHQDAERTAPLCLLPFYHRVVTMEGHKKKCYNVAEVLEMLDKDDDIQVDISEPSSSDDDDLIVGRHDSDDVSSSPTW